jgi:hypothetical protein
VLWFNAAVDRPAILAASDANLAEFMCRMANAEGAYSHEEDGLVLVAANHPNPGPYRNAAVFTGDSTSLDGRLERALEFFARRGRSFVLWVRDEGDAAAEVDHAAAGPGWRMLEDEGLPQLWREGPPEPVEPGEGITLTWATNADTRRDFVRVNADAWGLEGAPFETAAQIFFEPDLLDDPSGTTFAVVAYLEGRPASTCLAIVHPGDVVGGYWGATAAWALGHRLHDLTTRVAYNEAFAAFPQARVAVCQNSPGAAKTIARMGFEQVATWKRYLVPRP